MKYTAHRCDACMKEAAAPKMEGSCGHLVELPMMPEGWVGLTIEVGGPPPPSPGKILAQQVQHGMRDMAEASGDPEAMADVLGRAFNSLATLPHTNKRELEFCAECVRDRLVLTFNGQPLLGERVHP